jgi:hypothetical protein
LAIRTWTEMGIANNVGFSDTKKRVDFHHFNPFHHGTSTIWPLQVNPCNLSPVINQLEPDPTVVFHSWLMSIV